MGGGHRGVPDVSAAASPDSGWVTRDYGNWDTAGGTSAAAPFWAASMLLAEQYAGEAGRDAPLLPRADPLPARDDAQPFPAFHDVRPAATATTTQARAGTTRPASAHPTSGTSPAT